METGCVELSVIKLHFYCRKQMFSYIESLSHVSLHRCVSDHQACVLILCLLLLTCIHFKSITKVDVNTCMFVETCALSVGQIKHSVVFFNFHLLLAFFLLFPVLFRLWVRSSPASPSVELGAASMNSIVSMPRCCQLSPLKSRPSAMLSFCTIKSLL